MATSKLTRRALALRLFAAAVVVNLFLLWFFLPATPETKSSMPQGHVEIKVRAQLLTSFTQNKKVMLARPKHTPIGEALLARLDEDSVVLWLPEKIYRQHHQTLISEEWSLIPYLADLRPPQSSARGVSYEIAY